jgi:hypothetical protein
MIEVARVRITDAGDGRSNGRRGGEQRRYREMDRNRMR